MLAPDVGSDPDAADDPGSQLDALVPGLTIAGMSDVLRQGQAAFDDTTGNHPKTAPGWHRWSETNRAFRDLLAKLGCKPFDDQNIPKSRSPDGSSAFYATGGNVDTAKRHRIPTTKRPRGTASRKDVWDPNQVVIFPSLEPQPPTALKDTWILMYYHERDEARDKETLRAELSLPARVNKAGRIVGWRERIILPAIDLLEDIPLRRPDGDRPDTPDVSIKRKPAS